MRYWLALLLVLAGLRPAAAPAQTTGPVDSLRALLAAYPQPDTLRVRRLAALSSVLSLTDVPQAIVLLEQALALSRRLHDPAGEGQALTRLGTNYRRQANYARARFYTRQALSFFTRRADSAGLAKTYLQFSFIEEDQGNHAAALRAAFRGVAYAERGGDAMTQTRLQVAVGSIYVEMGGYREALPVLQSTLRKARALGDAHAMASVLNLLGKTYKGLRDVPRALAFYQQSAQLNRRLGDTQSLTGDETNLAELYCQQGDYRRARLHGLRVLAAARANGDAYSLPPAELVLARVYQAAGQPDSAIRLARHAFALSQPMRSKENLHSASDILAHAHAQRGDFEAAYRYQGLRMAYKDSLSGVDIQKKISDLRYGYELDKKQAQIALLTKTRQLQGQKEARQRQQLFGLLAGLLGAVLVVGLLARNIYLKQRANRLLNAKNGQIAQQRDDLDQALTRLQATQRQLVQSEKMVALAALTAGVAHEIQNPLNFVNNFAEVSVELMDELEEQEQQPLRNPAAEAELLASLKQNLRKIHQHGQRAGRIVRSMLDTSQASTGQRQPTDLNALVEEYLRLAYHGLAPGNRAVPVARPLLLDSTLGLVELVPTDIGRVLLILATNAFHAVYQQATASGPTYHPEVRVSTRRLPTHVEVRVRDNGTGIPAALAEKIFDPFFSTKVPGEGTGLGLWLAYDIIHKGHGGQLTVESQEGKYTEFTLTLPLVVG